MKTFDPLPPEEDRDFEKQLRSIPMRELPEDWKADILPPPSTPAVFPLPVLIALAACWTMTLFFLLTTPSEPSGSEKPLPPAPAFPSGYHASTPSFPYP